MFDKEGRARMATGAEIGNPSITLTQSEDQSEEKIEFIASTESHRTLGTMLDPTTSVKTEYHRLLKKGQDFARRYGAAPVNRRTARKAYQTIYLPSMGYTLPLTSFTRAELKKIQQAPIGVLLPSMGFNRNMPQVVVFGPTDMGGIGIRHLYIEQGSKQAALMLKHIRANTNIGKTLVICLRWYQRALGTSAPALSQPDLETPHAEGNWIMTLNEYLRMSECSIEIQALKGVQTYREDDRVLMDDDLLGPYTTFDLQCINRVRMYLQVECLSDIANAAGTQLDAGLVHTKTPNTMSTSTELWPVQGQPGRRSWSVWRRFLRDNYVSEDECTLRQPLGAWTQQPPRTWPAYYDPESHCIATPPEINAETDNWRYYATIREHRRYYIASPKLSFHDSAPLQALPVDSLVDNKYSHPSEKRIAITNRQQPGTFREFANSLDDWEKDLLRDFTENPAATPLFSLLTQAVRIYMVSDGGQKGEYGSFGWIIATDSEEIVKGKGFVRGYPMQSFRAEGYGRLAMKRYLLRYINFLQIEVHPHCRLRTYCDNESMLDAEQKRDEQGHDSPRWWLSSDCDVIDMLSETGNRMPTHSTDHVKGHQDDDTPYEELSRTAQLNVLADEPSYRGLV